VIRDFSLALGPCSLHLTREDHEVLLAGQAVVCPVCKALLRIEGERVARREAAAVKKGKGEGVDDA
jgi:hypothetical protein